MKVLLARYTCANCSTRFDGPALSDFAYGEFLLRSDSREVRYLNVFEDETFVEVRDMVGRLESSENFDLSGCPNVVQEIYGEAACDPDPQGRPFGITKKVSCPTCGSESISSHVLESELGIAQIEVPVVTHILWDRLSADEKRLKVLGLLTKYCVT